MWVSPSYLLAILRMGMTDLQSSVDILNMSGALVQEPLFLIFAVGDPRLREGMKIHARIGQFWRRIAEQRLEHGK